MYKRFVPGNNDEQEIRKLLKVIDNFKPDVIHVHGTEDNFGLVQMQSDIPVVISMQGILSPCAAKYYSGIPKNIARRHEGLLTKWIGSGTTRSYTLFQKDAERERRILNSAKFIIGRTEWDKRVTGVLAPKAQYFIGNEILRKSFYENRWAKTAFSKPLQIVTTTGGAIYKGFETVVNTAQILCKNSNVKFSWKVIGLSKNSNTVKIVQKWKDADLQKLNIELLGSKNAQDVVGILLSSDIYCQTSHIENSPNSLCEAMIVGMPIVATYAGGSSSLMQDKKEGFLVQDGDPYAIAGALVEYIKDFGQAADCGCRAYARAEKRHNRKDIAMDVYAIYKTMIGLYRNK
jgi:glycosyltransferase involved in cell wall biosynthesis